MIFEGSKSQRQIKELVPEASMKSEFSFSNEAGGEWPFAGGDIIWVCSTHLSAK